MSRKFFSNTNLIIVCCIFIALHILFYVGNVCGLMGKDDLINNIGDSLLKEADHWVDTGHYLVYNEDLQVVKQLRNTSWPEVGDEAQIIIIYNLHPALLYVNLKAPFKHDFHGDIKKKIITSIKLFKLKKLQKEVGHLLNKEIPKEKPEIKEQIVEKKGLKKL